MKGRAHSRERSQPFPLVEPRRPVPIDREPGRDGDRGSCGHFPLTARDLARRRRQRRSKLEVDEGLRAHGLERLEAGW